MGQAVRAVLRAGSLLAVAATAAAIVLGGIRPATSELRTLRPVREAAVNGYFFATPGHEPMVVDPESGAMRPVRLPEGDHLDQASCSPWHNDRGGFQVVGRWEGATGSEAEAVEREFGLMRCSFPDGAVLDRVRTDTVPSSPPCWFPDTSARVLFAAPDGWLYRCDFEGRSGPAGATPQPIEWPDDAAPGFQPVLMSDPCWPAEPALGGLAFVSLAAREGDGPPSRLSRRQIWWLRLSPDGRRVDAAGRVTIPDPAGPEDDETDERCPAAWVGPDGRPMLAYLSFQPGQARLPWRLHVVPIRFDATTRAPLALTAQGRLIAEDCLPIAPVPSADGLRLTYVEHDADSMRHPRVCRVELVPAPDTPLAASRTPALSGGDPQPPF